MKKLLLKSWENEKKFDERDSTREDLRVIKRERDGEKYHVIRKGEKFRESERVRKEMEREKKKK